MRHTSWWIDVVSCNDSVEAVLNFPCTPRAPCLLCVTIYCVRYILAQTESSADATARQIILLLYILYALKSTHAFKGDIKESEYSHSKALCIYVYDTLGQILPL